jgi:hypothetical protein
MQQKTDWVIIISDKTEKIMSKIVKDCDEETASIVAEKLISEYPQNGDYSWALHKII